MTDAEVLDVLRRAVSVVLERDTASLDRETRLAEDLEADSLAIVEIVEVVEEELTTRLGREVRLDDESLDGLSTLGDAVDQLQALL